MDAALTVVVVILCVVCGGLGSAYVRLCQDIRSLSGQLEEIGRGSHMELTAGSRRRELLKLCRRLNQVLASRDAQQMQYERAEKQMKQNITSLAHDIRTPLTGASGYVQLAGECTEPDRRAHYLEAAEKRLAQLGDMLEEMFLYTKLISEEFELSVERVQVLPLLGDCLLSLYTRFEERGISPDVAFESEGFWVQADEEALRRVFLNLIQNALLHGAGGLAVRQQGNSLIFENPVPEESIPDPGQIFDRFYKADKSRRKGSSGLGLFIVKELMEKMGGEVSAQMDGRKLRIGLEFLPRQADRAERAADTTVFQVKGGKIDERIQSDRS